jgi:hypothetical protein
VSSTAPFAARAGGLGSEYDPRRRWSAARIPIRSARASARVAGRPSRARRPASDTFLRTAFSCHPWLCDSVPLAKFVTVYEMDD